MYYYICNGACYVNKILIIKKNTYIHTYIHTWHTGQDGCCGETESERRSRNSSITKKSGNLRKDLKNDIHVSVSTLRKAFSHLIHQLDNVKEEYNRYREEVKNATNSDVTGGFSQPTKQVAPSPDHSQQSQNTGARKIMTSGGGRRKVFFGSR